MKVDPLIASLALALCLGAPSARAGLVEGGTISFLADGTSNTVLLTEQTRLAVCLQGVTGGAPLDGISDGTSHTIVFGPSLSLTVRVGTSLVYQPIDNIRDGSSNTVFLGESSPVERCFSGETEIVDIGNAIVDGSSNTIEIAEGSRFDVCFRNISLGRVADGSSNTFVFGELTSSPACFADVSVTATTAAAVPEPGTLPLLALGFAGLCFASSRRGAR